MKSSPSLQILDKSIKNQLNLKNFKNLLLAKKDFKILSILGEGATSIVYETIYLRTKEKFALKTVPKILDNKILISQI